MQVFIDAETAFGPKKQTPATFCTFALITDHWIQKEFRQTKLAGRSQKKSLAPTKVSNLTTDRLWGKVLTFFAKQLPNSLQYICQQHLIACSKCYEISQKYKNKMHAVYSDPPKIAANPPHLDKKSPEIHLITTYELKAATRSGFSSQESREAQAESRRKQLLTSPAAERRSIWQGRSKICAENIDGSERKRAKSRPGIRPLWSCE